MPTLGLFFGAGITKRSPALEAVGLTSRRATMLSASVESTVACPDASVVATVDGLHCPACAAHFRAPPSECVPVTHACGHSTCADCDAQLQASGMPVCAVCLVPVGKGSINLGLAVYAESRLGVDGGFIPCCPLAASTAPILGPLCCSECQDDDPEDMVAAVATCAECEGKPFCEDDANKHRRKTAHALTPIVGAGGFVPAAVPTIANCSKHPDTPLKYYCVEDRALLCSECLLREGPDGHLSPRSPASRSILEPAAAIAKLSADMSSSVASCVDGVARTMQAAGSVQAAIEQLDARFRATHADFAANVDRVVAALIALRTRISVDAERLHHDRKKALEAQLEALTVSSGQLGAVTALAKAARDSNDILMIAHAAADVEKMSAMLTAPLAGPCVPPVAEVVFRTDHLLSAIRAAVYIKSDYVAAKNCVASGPGLMKCVSGGGEDALSNNRILVACRDDTGATGTVIQVTPSDVEVTVRGVVPGSPAAASGGAGCEATGRDSPIAAASVGAVVTTAMKDCIGAIEVVYTIREDYEGDDVLIDVRVGGSGGQHVPGSPFRVNCPVKGIVGPPNTCQARGRHVRTIPVVSASKYGMAVSPDERWMAVSEYGGQGHTVTVYDLASGSAVRVIGGPKLGKRPCEFSNPFKVCFTPTGNILVCDYSNGRVQEVTVDGTHVRSITMPTAWTVCCDGSAIVVGRYCAGSGTAIHKFAFKSGQKLLDFARNGSAAGQIGSNVEGLRITPDGKHLLVSEFTNKRLSLFTLEGTFVKHIGAGIVSDGHKDVEFAENGDIIVADYGNNRICVFSADGSTLLRCWGGRGSGDGQFRNPTALAVRGSRLYVLDCSSPRVQVFE